MVSIYLHGQYINNWFELVFDGTVAFWKKTKKCHFTIVWNKEFNSFRDANNDEHGCKGYFVKKSRKEIIL